MAVLDVTPKFCPTRPLNCFDIDPMGKEESPRRVGPLSYGPNSIYLRPFDLPLAITVNALYVRVVKPSAYDLWGFGIYTPDGNTRKFSLIVTPQQKGVIEASVAGVDLPNGSYLLAWASTGREAQTYLDFESQWDGSDFLIAEARTGIAGSCVGAALPTTLEGVNALAAPVGIPVLVLSS